MTGAPPVASQPGARVVVAGASGLIGRALLARLAGDVRVGSVTALVRRPTALGRQPASVQPLVVDHGALGQRQPLPAADWAFCALGTTIQTAGSQAAFRAVDVDAVLAFALAARAAGATRLGLVSAMGADVRSRVFYNRCKGEVEQALAAQGWPQLVVARPSLLLGARDALGQPRPQVQPEGDNAVRVTVAPGPGADALAARLRELLAPLPLTVHTTTGPAAGSPATP